MSVRINTMRKAPYEGTEDTRDVFIVPPFFMFPCMVIALIGSCGQ